MAVAAQFDSAADEARCGARVTRCARVLLQAVVDSCGRDVCEQLRARMGLPAGYPLPQWGVSYRGALGPLVDSAALRAGRQVHRAQVGDVLATPTMRRFDELMDGS